MTISQLDYRPDGRGVFVTGGAALIFPRGRYDFWYTLADQDFYYLSNNDDGIKPVAFPLTGFKNVTVDGQGFRFVFHGGMVPAIVRGSKGITLKNFSIDWDVPFNCEGFIEAVNKKQSYVDVRIKKGYRYKVENNRFIFVGEGFENPVLKNLLEFDTKKRSKTSWRVTISNVKFSPLPLKSDPALFV